MAFLTNEQMKNFRARIKEEFPSKSGWKFSVTKRHHGELCISLMQFPSDYSFPAYAQINHFHVLRQCQEMGLGTRETRAIAEIVAIATMGYWDDSDYMTDYFYCSHYISISIGKWDKPARAK